LITIALLGIIFVKLDLESYWANKLFKVIGASQDRTANLHDIKERRYSSFCISSITALAIEDSEIEGAVNIL